MERSKLILLEIDTSIRDLSRAYKANPDKGSAVSLYLALERSGRGGKFRRDEIAAAISKIAQKYGVLKAVKKTNAAFAGWKAEVHGRQHPFKMVDLKLLVPDDPAMFGIYASNVYGALEVRRYYRERNEESRIAYEGIASDAEKLGLGFVVRAIDRG